MAQFCEIKTDFVALSREFLGKWVAIDPATNKVVSAGSTAREVVDEARAHDVKEPLIFRVSDDYGSYVSCLA